MRDPKILDICLTVGTKVKYIAVTDRQINITYDKLQLKDYTIWKGQRGDFFSAYQSHAGNVKGQKFLFSGTKIFTRTEGTVDISDDYIPVARADFLFEERPKLVPVWTETAFDIMSGKSKGRYMFLKKSTFDRFVSNHIPDTLCKYIDLSCTQ